MQRSSDAIGTIAGAFAKAQAEPYQSGQIAGGNHSDGWPNRPERDEFLDFPVGEPSPHESAACYLKAIVYFR